MSHNMITYELQDGSSIYYIYLIPSADNLHIKYSHQVHDRSDMIEILNYFKKLYPDHPVSKISNLILVQEWCTHNLCYDLGIAEERTGSTDLNVKPWYYNTMYVILGLLYW